MIENLNITDIANEYAKNNALESFSHIIASAYAAGYKKGFTDCEKGLAKPHELDYVDLGLPSGTLWSISELKSDGVNVDYLTWAEAQELSVPTIEQWRELVSFCHFECEDSVITIYGTNRNTLSLQCVGFIKGDEKYGSALKLWLRSNSLSNPRKFCGSFTLNRGGFASNCNKPYEDMILMGTRCPVLLVKVKDA